MAISKCNEDELDRLFKEIFDEYDGWVLDDVDYSIEQLSTGNPKNVQIKWKKFWEN